MEIIDTKLKSLVFEKQGFAIFRLDNGDSASGNVVGMTPKQILDSKIQLTGEWHKNKYGRTFKFTKFQINEDQIVHFLSRVIGHITKAAATEISKLYGEKVWDILDNNPEVLLEIKGIGQKKIKKIQESWKKCKGLWQLSKILTPVGVTNNQLFRIHEHFGEAAYDTIVKNPYSIIQIRGIGFKIADDIAIKIGISLDDPERSKACAEFTIREFIDSSGDTALLSTDVVKAMQEYMAPASSGNVDIKTCISGLSDLVDIGKAAFVLDIETDDDTRTRISKNQYVSLRYVLKAENAIIKAVEVVTSNQPVVSDIDAWIRAYEAKHRYQFGDEQKDAIRLANTMPRVFSVSGYAGTGKTTTSKAILELIGSKYTREDIVCCALAGIAANRIKIQSGYESSTIHSLLGFDGTGFLYNHENKLPYKIVMLDESSMADIDMFYRLIDAIDFSTTTLVLLGDPAQLEPVGGGQPYVDILHHKLVPNVTLTRIYRQSKDAIITTMAQSVRNGQVPELEGEYEDFKFIEQAIPDYSRLRSLLPKEEMVELRDKNNNAILQQVLEFAKDYKQSLFSKITPSTLWEYITHFQVISPIKKGVLGVENLNTELQKIFNPDTPGREFIDIGHRVFRVNDKVVHLRNKNMPVMQPGSYMNYRKSEFDLDEKRTFNGQLGVVIGATLEEVHVLYPVEGTVVVYSKPDLMSGILDLSFALTYHKVQGSEFEIVVMPMSLSHYNMQNPRSFYTGMTRARKYLAIIGQKEAVQASCNMRVSRDRTSCMDVILRDREPVRKPSFH